MYVYVLPCNFATDIYHLRMRIGNNFTQVCLSVCPLSVCVSVCESVYVSVQAITFELLQLGTSFSVYRYILTTSRSSLSIKVIGSRSTSNLFFCHILPKLSI